MWHDSVFHCPDIFFLQFMSITLMPGRCRSIAGFVKTRARLSNGIGVHVIRSCWHRLLSSRWKLNSQRSSVTKCMLSFKLVNRFGGGSFILIVSISFFSLGVGYLTVYLRYNCPTIAPSPSFPLPKKGK